MIRSEFDGLRPLRREILLDIRTLRAIEKKEQAAKKSNRDLMRSIRVIVLEPDIEERKKKLIETIYDNQRRYLRKQSELEQMIADIDDQYVRLVFSLCSLCDPPFCFWGAERDGVRSL